MSVKKAEARFLTKEEIEIMLETIQLACKIILSLENMLKKRLKS